MNLLNILTIALYIALYIHLGLLLVSLFRVWRGENVIDRLMGTEMVTTLTLAILVIITLITGASIYMDVALALAALGFVATIALARYIADEQMF